ncbi:MAG: discoidin domain-containing protein, partial [Rikenellaceae bacterium]|nr:discoidin domain-containing protein [Rikenellaceae bacterium]
MKRLIYVMSVVAAFALSLAACTMGPEEQQPTQSFLSLERDTLWVAATGTAEPELVAVNSSSDKWIFSSDEAWLTVDQSFDLTTGYLNISVEENTADTSREAIVYLFYQDLTAQLVVVQLADTHVEAAHIIPSDTLYQVQIDGGVLPISVIADGEYTVSTDASWMSYDGQQQTDAGVVENIYISKSYDKLPRYGVVTFASEQTTASVRVMQWGSQALFVDNTEDLSFAFVQGSRTITLTANGEWTPSCDAEWVNWEVKSGAVVDTLVLSVENNIVTEARNATLTIACGSESVSINIAQEAMREFGDVSKMEYPLDTQVAVKDATASSMYSKSYAATKAVDGDEGTYWYSDYDEDNDPWITLELNPKSYEQIDYVVYSSNATSGHWGEVDIYVMDDKYNETKIGTYDFAMSKQAICVNLDTPIKGASAIRFHILTSYNHYPDKYPDRRYATAYEVKLFTRAKTADPLALFTDWSLSELRADVTLEQIEAMDNEAYRSIAEQLYFGVYDSEFRVCKFKAFPHPDKDAAIFRTNTYTLLDNVTGMYVAEVGDTVHVYVNDTHGLPITLRIIDWVNMESASAATSNRTYVSAQSKYVNHSYPLMQGHNQIVAETRGLMYILC